MDEIVDQGAYNKYIGWIEYFANDTLQPYLTLDDVKRRALPDLAETARLYLEAYGVTYETEALINFKDIDVLTQKLYNFSTFTNVEPIDEQIEDIQTLTQRALLDYSWKAMEEDFYNYKNTPKIGEVEKEQLLHEAQNAAQFNKECINYGGSS